MQDPYMIKDDGTLEPWPRYTNDTDILLYSETIATIVEPDADIRKKYEIVTK
jgi:phosphoribulokinase